MSDTGKETKRYCDLCKKWINFGDGGEKNFKRHEETADHKKLHKAQNSKGGITSFFARKLRPPPPPANSTPPAALLSAPIPGPSATPSLAPATASPIIDVDEIDDRPASVVGTISDLRGEILARLRNAITTLPQGVPVATETDFLALFAVNPLELVRPDTDPWEDFVHGNFDSFLLQGPRHRSTIELSELIRRGELGMDGFLIWLQRCFFELKISPAMVEDRVDRIIHAMVFLGSTTVNPPSVPLATLPSFKSVKKIPAAQVGCVGQTLPLEPNEKPALAYPIGIHAEREHPWSVQFTKQAVVLRSDDCLMRAQKVGVCSACAKLLRHPVIKGIIERNHDGARSSTPYAYLTIGQLVVLLRKKNEQINKLKLSGLNLARTLTIRATHLSEHSRFVMAVSKGDVPRIGW
ncbi:hypothetical protein C8R46DRAFT_1230950 [Mycena filopes]|nr:hypothetical protein C8R46DRAFT_1230950 [Mycena filopes]